MDNDDNLFQSYADWNESNSFDSANLTPDSEHPQYSLNPNLEKLVSGGLSINDELPVMRWELEMDARQRLNAFIALFGTDKPFEHEFLEQLADALPNLATFPTLLPDIVDFVFGLEDIFLGHYEVDLWRSVLIGLLNPVLQTYEPEKKGEEIYLDIQHCILRGLGLSPDIQSMDNVLDRALDFQDIDLTDDSVGILTRIEHLNSKLNSLSQADLEELEPNIHAFASGLEPIGHSGFQPFALMRAYVLMSRYYSLRINHSESFIYAQQANILAGHQNFPMMQMSMTALMVGALTSQRKSWAYVRILLDNYRSLAKNNPPPLLGLALYHAQFATYFRAKTKYIEAVAAYDRALALYEKLDDTLNIIILLLGKGYSLAKVDLFDRSIQAYQSAISILEQKDNPAWYQYYLMAMHGLGWVYLLAEARANAIFYLSRALDIAQDPSHPPSDWKASQIESIKKDLAEAKSL